MPDRWGRVGYEDFAEIANTINTIQAMGQRNTSFQQQQDEYKKKIQDEADTNTNASNIINPPMQSIGGEPYAVPMPPKMIGTPRAQVAGKNLAVMGMQADRYIAENKDTDAIKERTEKIYSYLQQNGPESMNSVPPDWTAGIVGHKAFVNAVTAATSTEEAQSKLTATRMARFDKTYPIFELQKEAVNKALLEGREHDMIIGLKQMSKDLPIPYQLGEYNPEDRTYDVQYFDRRTGKLQSVEKKPVTQLIGEMNKVGKEQYYAQGLIHAEAKRLENLKTEANPLRGKTSGGTSVLITPQIPPEKSDGNLNIRVKNEKTGELIAEYKTWEALYDSGTDVEDLKREKAMVDIKNVETNIDQSKQAIITSKEAALAHKATAAGQGVENLSKTSELYKKNFALLSQPFAQPGTSIEALLNSDAPESKNAVDKAFKFWEANKEKADSLNKTDKLKLDSASKIIQLSEQSNARIGALHKLPTEMQPSDEADFYKGATAPVEGAKKAKDGLWYVQQGKDWFPVKETRGKAKTESSEDPQETRAMGRTETNGQSVSNDPLPEAQSISETLPPDPKEWRIRPVKVGLNNFEYIATDINGEDHKLNDAELQKYMEVTTPKQGPIFNPAKEIGSAMSGFYQYQKSNPLFKQK